MDKQYELNSLIYTVTNCTHEDIPFHIERVLPYWTQDGADIDEQQLLLEQAVDSQTAWKVIDEQGNSHAAMYCIMLNIRNAMSNLLWFENKRFFAMLCYHLREKEELQYIYFLPHSKTFIPFKFIVQDFSIRLFHSHDEPLQIDLFSTKAMNLYERHYVKYGIREV